MIWPDVVRFDAIKVPATANIPHQRREGFLGVSIKYKQLSLSASASRKAPEIELRNVMMVRFSSQLRTNALWKRLLPLTRSASA